MADEKGGSAITDMLQSKAGLAAIFVALASLLMIKPSPLNSERPNGATGGNKSIGALQDVDARLWQDPFQAVNDATKSTAADRLEVKAYDGKRLTVEIVASKTQNSHLPGDLFSEQPSVADAGKITVMAVMMTASPTPEEHEARLRRRYALVSALSNRDYAPVDSEHIGYFKNDSSKYPNLPEIVPFEWFEKTGGSKPDKVLVLWVDDTKFDVKPVQKTYQLFEQITTLPNRKTSVLNNSTRVVMGPSSSGKLKAMALEAKDWKNNKSMSDVWFYSSQATTADAEILKDIPDGYILSNYLKKNNINLRRTITDDNKLVDSLVKELSLRRISPDNTERQYAGIGIHSRENHVVLLSDWDTLYGRTLPLSFEHAYENDPESKCGSLDDLGEHVHCFKYVRGIDGILAGARTDNDTKSSQSKSEPGSASTPIDRPDGMSQKDYLRRIVGEIRKLDERLQKSKECLHSCGVVAIGVLGYDVYDKLMILRALRPYFPNKTFFTTDLSASYGSPEELPFTHNMIVSSGFGLNLNPQLQKDIPPFRDSYQTGLFLSVLLALDETKMKEIPGVYTPRIFEIGRNGPVDLSDPVIPVKRSSIDCAHDVSQCNSVHPGSFFEQSQEDGKTRFKFILAACCFVLLYLASWNVRKWINHIFLRNESDEPPDNPASPLRKIHLKRTGIVLFLLFAAFVVLWCANNNGYNKEPLLWLEGVSIWPSELLRFVGLVASIVLIHDVFRKISMNDWEIGKAFGFIEQESETPPAPGFLKTLFQALSSWSNCSSVHKWQSTKDKPWLNETAVNGLIVKDIEVSKLWKSYLEKGEPKRRVCRTLVGMVPFLIFAWSAIVLSGGMTSPVRGNLAFVVDKFVTFPVVILMLFLTVLIIDASRLSAAFIKHLDEAQSDWRKGSTNLSCTMIQLSQQWGLKPAYTAYWLDTQFVAQRTEAIQKLIWYPVVPIFLLAIARSPVFDDWSHPAGLIATLTILIVYLISCAFLLERGAKNMRQKASCKLSEVLRKLRGSFGSGKNSKIDRLQNMIKEIEGLKQGAFLPLFRQPWVEAVLALASGAGGLAWMGNILGTP